MTIGWSIVAAAFLGVLFGGVTAAHSSPLLLAGGEGSYHNQRLNVRSTRSMSGSVVLMELSLIGIRKENVINGPLLNHGLPSYRGFSWIRIIHLYV